ncbi:MAG: ABC transporter permease [Synergistaceae bacterium]|jgi:ABC-2 type transport system permease protein|nr:ABC transporter permease [Synergistaceae bacterium]
MKSGRRLLALVKKEWVQILRDPSSIVIAFVIPLVLLFLFGYGLSLDAREIRLGIAAEDGGWEARDLTAAFLGSPYFRPLVSPARQELFQKVVAGDLKGVLVIPAGFSAALRSGRAERETQVLLATVLLATDGTFPNTGSMVENYSLGLLSQWAEGLSGSAGGVEVESRYWYNSELESRYSLLPGIMAMIMSLIGTMLTSLVVAREWERGTMEALLSTPVGAMEILLGKLIPYYLLAIFSTFFSLGVAVGLFGIPFRGSLIMLFCVGSLFMLSALGQGLIISTLAKNQYVASFAALLSAFLPAALLSGFIFEIDAMPPLQRAVAAVLPARYLVSSLQTLFLVGDAWGVLIPDMLTLAAFGVVLLGLTLCSTRKRL